MKNQNNNVENLTKEQLKLEYNKKMIDKRVFITLNSGGYFGTVTDIVDLERFKVKTDKGEDRIVEIYDIRSTE